MTQDNGMARTVATGDKVFQNGTYIGEVKRVSDYSDEIMLDKGVVISGHSMDHRWGQDNCWDLDPSVPLDATEHVPVVSLRGRDWVEFAAEVFAHIEEYTTGQYGDKGNDLASEYTVYDCMHQIKKYTARHGRNLREGQDKLDLLKIAHYACIAWTLMEGR